ncbi:hypothetical protein RND81_09G110700 [Saponaria officinalis]|uniref:Lectin n=1 Tax=Saponaria officinalis TaxID=3572 RepID=A0AAW1IL73_SAPOF
MYAQNLHSDTLILSVQNRQHVTLSLSVQNRQHVALSLSFQNRQHVTLSLYVQYPHTVDNHLQHVHPDTLNPSDEAVQKDNRELYKIDEHHWAGKSDENYPFPPTIKHQPTPIIPFKHSGPNPEGSVAGVVYADGHDSTARKWVIAFDTSRRKVYVEAGPIGPVDWGVIKVKLDQSGPNVEYLDPILGGLIYV